MADTKRIPDDARENERAEADAAGEAARSERAERMLEEGKRRLEETLEGDLNETLGE